MSTLTLSDIERSIKKVSDMVDVQLKDLNSSFMVDNYQAPNTLRNSILRSEFNNLCKGKTEAKKMDEVSYENEKKIYLCKEDQIRDIPPLLKSLFDNPKKYYIMGTPSEFSFFYSLLSILDAEFLLEGKSQKDKIIDDLRNTLVYNLDTFYTQNNYKEKRFKKSVIRDNILNSKHFLPQVIHYILDYHKMCLLVIDTETYLYTLACDYHEDRDYIIMLRKNNYYQPILNSEGKSKFTTDMLQRLSVILKPEFEIDTKPIAPSIVNTNTSESVVVSVKLEKESSYKIAELQSIAEKIGLCIKQPNTNKNKKKSELYSEIKSKLNQ